MNKEGIINKLFNQAKDQSPLLDLDEVKKIIASGRELYISQKQKIKFNKSGLPKNIWFNLKNIFVMTGFIATVTVSILIVYPTLKQSKQFPGYLKDQATIQENKNIQNEQIGYQRKDTLSIEMVSDKQENFIDTKQVSQTKLSRMPQKESNLKIIENIKTSTSKSIRNQSSEDENKSPKIVDKIILINDTIFKGDHLILDLSNEQLVGLGFLIDGTGFYYKNQIPSGIKIGLWSR